MALTAPSWRIAKVHGLAARVELLEPDAETPVPLRESEELL
jgi:hypothetical protein